MTFGCTAQSTWRVALIQLARGDKIKCLSCPVLCCTEPWKRPAAPAVEPHRLELSAEEPLYSSAVAEDVAHQELTKAPPPGAKYMYLGSTCRRSEAGHTWSVWPKQESLLEA